MSTVTCTFCGSDYEANLEACPSCGGNPTAFDNALPNGTALDGGKYTVVRVLGQGGFGITYEGHDEILHRTVAIKELFPENAFRQGLLVAVHARRQGVFQSERRQVVDEARRVASFNSHNIVEIYATFEENDTAYIVMEFLSGRSLEAEINQLGPLDAEDVQRIALELCDALKEVHGKDMLHRDIKPANVMLTDDGRTVLIDFGAAREFVLHQTLQHTRIFAPMFAAPEQFLEEARFGPYTDIFLLGATLFYALVGFPPKSAIDRMHDSEASLAVFRDRQGPLDMAIQRALSIPIDDRPQSIDAFRDLLQSNGHVDKLPTLNRSILKFLRDGVGEWWRFVTHRWVVTVAVGITILLAVIIGRYSMPQRQASFSLSPSFNTTPRSVPRDTPTPIPVPTSTATRTPTPIPTRTPTPTPTPTPITTFYTLGELNDVMDVNPASFQMRFVGKTIGFAGEVAKIENKENYWLLEIKQHRRLWPDYNLNCRIDKRHVRQVARLVPGDVVQVSGILSQYKDDPWDALKCQILHVE